MFEALLILVAGGLLILATCAACFYLPVLLVQLVIFLATSAWPAFGYAFLAVGRTSLKLEAKLKRPYIEWRNRRRLIRAIRLAPMQQRQALKQVELALAHGAQLMDEAADPSRAKRREWRWWSR